MTYWEECLSEAFDEQKLIVTDEQLKAVAQSVQSCHENYGLAYPTPENPLIRELSEAKKALSVEREKVVCPRCKGMGLLTDNGPYHSSTSSCPDCRGSGKVSP